MQPELAETLQKARELMQQARGEGEAAEAARKQLQELGRQALEIQRKLDGPTQKLMGEDGELRALRQEQIKRSEPMLNLVKELEERLSAKILASSPESKELLDKRKALQEELRKLMTRQAGGPTPAQMEERRKKFEELRTMAQGLDQKLNPVRQKLLAEDQEVQALQKQATDLQQQLQDLLFKKMAESSPDLAESIERRKEISKQMRELWQGTGPR